jgi:hypothetical protein
MFFIVGKKEKEEFFALVLKSIGSLAWQNEFRRHAKDSKLNQLGHHFVFFFPISCKHLAKFEHKHPHSPKQKDTHTSF